MRSLNVLVAPLSVVLAFPMTTAEITRCWSQTPESVSEPKAGEPNELIAARLFPPTTVLYAEVANPLGLVEFVVDHPLRTQLEQLQPYQVALESDEFQQFTQFKTFLESHFELTWREALGTLAAGGAAIGVDAASEGIAVVVHAADRDALESFRDRAVALAKLGAQRDRYQTGEYRGVTAHRIDDVRYVVWEDWLLVTNNSELGKAILDRLLDRGGDSLAENERLRQAIDKRQPDASAWSWADVESIRLAGIARQTFEGHVDNPVAELIAGGLQDNLQHTPYVTLELQTRADDVALLVRSPHRAEWISEQREYFFGPDSSGRAPQLPKVDETLLIAGAYRDVSEMWMRAGDLFDERIVDGFAQADANLTTLFAGRDFGEEILGTIEPEIGLIATRQDFHGRLPVPTIKLPQFALVMDLREPAEMTRELRRIFQSLVGFLNVVGAMEGRNQLELGQEELPGGAELVSSTFVPEADEQTSTQANIIFNLSPSIGFSGKRFVIASTKALARELTVAPDTDQAASDDNLHAELDADVLRTVLADNRDQLVAQNMLEDGNSRAEAEAAIDLLLELVGMFRDSQIRLGTSPDSLEIEFQLSTEASQ